MSNATERLADMIDNEVDYLRQEYEASYPEVIGTLIYKAWLLCLEGYQSTQEEEGEDHYF